MVHIHYGSTLKQFIRQGQEGKSKNGKKDSTPTITTTNDY